MGCFLGTMVCPSANSMHELSASFEKGCGPGEHRRRLCGSHWQARQEQGRHHVDVLFCVAFAFSFAFACATALPVACGSALPSSGCGTCQRCRLLGSDPVPLPTRGLTLLWEDGLAWFRLQYPGMNSSLGCVSTFSLRMRRRCF